MRKQSGYENDWIDALNSASRLANTMSRTRATGLQIEQAENENLKNENDKRIADFMADGLRQGEPPDALMSYASGRPENERAISPNVAFDFSGAEGLPPSEATRGLNTSMDDLITQKQNDYKLKADQYIKEFSGLSQDDLSRLDPTKYGKDSFAARVAQGKVLAQMGETEGNRATMLKNRDAVAGQMFNQFNAAIKESEQLIRAGDKNTAMQIMANAINQSNNTAYKARVTDKGIQMYITEDGEDVRDTQTLSPEQALGKLKSVSKQDYFRHFHLAAEDARRQNIESLEKPIIMSDGKDIYQVIKTSNPLSSDFKHEAYSLTTGAKAPYQSLAEMRKHGFYNAAIPGADGKGAGKNMDVKGEQWKEAQIIKMAGVEAINSGLPFEFGPEGELVPTGPMNETQKQDAVRIFGKYGVTPAMAMNRKSRWGGLAADEISYDYKGMSPYMGKGMAMGLQPAETSGDEQPSESMSQAAIKKAFGGTQEPDKPEVQPAQKSEAAPQVGMTDEQFRFQRLVSMAQASAPKPADVSDEEWSAALAKANEGALTAEYLGRNLGEKRTSTYGLDRNIDRYKGLRYR